MAAPDPDLQDIERSLRSLQLPLDPTAEHALPGIAHALLNELGIPTSEQPAAIASDVREWVAEARPPSRLKRLVEAILQQCAGTAGEALADGYFDAHSDLTDRCELDFGAAQNLLSSARLVVHLIISERMSCAQAARVLSAPMRGVSYNWNQVQSVATRLGITAPALDAATAGAVFDRDCGEEIARFADSTPEVELELLLDASRMLGFGGDARSAFGRILRPDFDAALMTLLHFVLTVCEHYDHPPSAVYEFNPRGRALKYLQAQNPLYAARGSAALNVAKAAVELDDRWAWGRKGERRGDALALVAIFRGLEQMHYPARRELASWLRQWIVRMHARHGGTHRWLPGVSTGTGALHLLESLAARPTRTYGTIEQRVVDALSLVLHPEEEWNSRGRKDSVFASNTSRRKMGDCEYVSRRRANIVTYEAHAGDLTDSYVDEHCQSLSQVVDARREDLEARAEAHAWDIRVVFVAHQVRTTNKRRHVDVGDFLVEFEMTDYAAVLERVREEVDSRDDGDSELAGAVNDSVIGPLNEAWIPQAIRDRVLNDPDAGLAHATNS